jgi:cysteine desulfurase / selenocysteine lyase
VRSAALRAEAPSIDWRAIRARFPAASAQTYLNIGSKSILSNAAAEAARAALDLTWHGTDKKSSDNEPYLREVRGRFASIIGATADDVAITKNVTEGINAIASGLHWSAGDNVVVCSALEHPNNIYAWLAVRARGVELRDVAPVGNAIDASAMIAAIDRRTRVVTASSVTFTPGFRTDVAAIGSECRHAGVMFVVDGVQSTGVMHLDVNAANVDALATSTSKGLLGVPGLGFLYVRREWAEQLTPASIGRYSVVRGGHQSEIESFDYRLLGDARRFEAGNYNWIGLAAAHASMSELLGIGIPNVEAHATSLAHSLARGLSERGFAVNQPSRDWQRSHLVTVGQLGSGSAYTSDDPRLNRFAAALEAANVSFSVRRGLLRFGFHCYSDATDVAAVLSVADEVC